LIYLAEAPGSHPTISFCGSFICKLDIDSLISTALAIAVTLAVGFAIAYRLSHGVPGKLQMVLEFLLDYTRRLVADNVHVSAGFVVPLAATIGFYILVANWIDFLPLSILPNIIPANADLNQTAAMAILVFLIVEWYSVKVLGWGGFFRRFTKPFDLNWGIRGPFIVLNILEELVKPVTLALRLFGNIFAGTVMAYLIVTLLPGVIAWLPLAAWKIFDVGLIGAIQAFIFMLLTIVYFGMAREGLEEEAHVAAAGATAHH
jgi:F-type H+-transporting ATPase subunit a